MFINPKTAIAEGWVKFPDWMTEDQKNKCIQPNAIDFTIDQVSVITPTLFIVSEDKTKVVHREQKKLSTVYDGFFHLLNDASTKYDFYSDFYVNLPEGVAALVIARSTLNRNGIFLTTGLWDSGFKGNIAGVLHNDIGPSHIEQHVRIGQIMFIKSEVSGELYAGGYNTANGQHWDSSYNALVSAKTSA